MRLLAFVIFLSAAIDTHCQQNFTWRDAQKIKKGTITIFWFPNNSFGFEEPGGRLTGIEVEIMRLFQQYLKSKHGVQVEINWVPQETFKQVLDHMRYDSLSGVFGVAGFSFTEERKTFMKFSPSYMADMAVLVSTNDIPVVRNQQDLQKSFTGATALTAQGTILEKELLALRQENNLDFDIEYTGGSALLIDLLQTRKKSFGYLNLPVYLMGINNGITTLHRHNYLTKRYEGRGNSKKNP
ncbi:MAG: transporter substrate-binding domain-containing protein, partial [Bacteroidetes bacterium]|nr:transporter substrate-binding domain-containing protein [Bacteroidota bacterium]